MNEELKRTIDNTMNVDCVSSRKHTIDDDKDKATDDDRINGSVNPWSLLGISKDDIENALRTDDLLHHKQCHNTKLKTPSTGTCTGATKHRSTDMMTSATSTNDTTKVPTTAMTGKANTNKYRSGTKRKLPMTVNVAAAVTSKSIPIPSKEMSLQERKSSLCSYTSTYSDQEALQSITSSTSFLETNPGCTNGTTTTDELNTVIQTEQPQPQHQEPQQQQAISFMTPQGTPSPLPPRSRPPLVTQTSTKCPDPMTSCERNTTATCSAAVSGLVPVLLYQNNHNLNRMMQTNDYCGTQDTRTQQPWISQHPYINNNFSSTTNDYNYQIYQNHYYRSELFGLQVQYEHAIQRITNSMRQSNETKWILHHQREFGYHTQHIQQQQRQFSLLSTNSRMDSPNHQPNHQHQHHNDAINTQCRRKSSIQLTSHQMTIDIPYASVNDGDKESSEKSVDPTTNTQSTEINPTKDLHTDDDKVIAEDIASAKVQQDDDAVAKVNDGNDKDDKVDGDINVNDITNNDNDNVPSAMPRSDTRRRSSDATKSTKSTQVGDHETLTVSSPPPPLHEQQAVRRSSSVFLSNDRYNNSCPLPYPSNGIGYSNNQTPQCQKPPPMEQVQGWMPHCTTNVDETRHMLYTILHSSNHVQDFMR
jgi:hypothetical protein